MRIRKGASPQGRPFSGKPILEGLALRELEATSRLGAAVFLALDDARVAGEEARLLQRRAQVRLVIGEGAADAVAHRTRLAGEAATGHSGDDVVLAEAIGGGERLVDQHAEDRPREIDLDLAPVDHDLAVAGLDPDARDGVLALARGIGALERIDARRRRDFLLLGHLRRS